MVVEAEILKSGCQHGQVLVKALFLCLQRVAFFLFLTYQRERESACSGAPSFFFFKWHESHYEGPTLTTSSKHNYLPKVLSSNTITMEVRASICVFWGHTLHSIAICIYTILFLSSQMVLYL